MEIKKFESIKFFIWDEYIKNNSNINLDDENHIRIVWSCRNAAKTHNFSYIPLKFDNWKTSCQNFNQI